MTLRDFSGIDRTILIYFCTILLLSFPTNLLRLSVSPLLPPGYFDFLFLTALVLAPFNVFLVLRAPIREMPFGIIFFIFLLWIFVVGILRDNEDPINGLRYYALPLSMFMLLVGRKYVTFFYESKKFWMIMLASHVVGLVYYYISLYGLIYPGIGVQSIGFASIFFICQGHWLLFAISLIVIFLEGKRSILLSLFISIIFLRLIKFKAGMRFVYFIAAAFCAVILLSGILILIADIEGSTTVSRINYLNPFSDSYDLYLGSSGRLGELTSFFKDRGLMDTFLGSGAGFRYEWSLGYSSEQDGEIKGYFHMSPVNYIASGGIVGILVFAYMMLLPFRASQLNISLQARQTAFGLGIFAIAQSFFGFNLATDATSLIFILGPAMLPTNSMANKQVIGHHKFC